MIDDFLKELTDLCNKHGVVICGCGCCGSPMVEKTDGKAISRYTTEQRNSYGDVYWEYLSSKYVEATE